VVLGPVGVGLMIHHFAPRLAERARRFTPLLSVLIVSLICGSIIGQTAATALSAGPVVCRPTRGTPPLVRGTQRRPASPPPEPPSELRSSSSSCPARATPANEASFAAVNGTHTQVLLGVFLLHSLGFMLGYGVPRALGYSTRVSRTTSIEVGIQSSALAVVLATRHFPHPVQSALPSAISATVCPALDL
jgi:predicted Na+-dependent transporter